MSLKIRENYYGASTGIATPELCRTSVMVSRLTGLAVARNKAIVGANAFAHSSGIHQDGVLKDRRNYEIMDPEEVGAAGTQIVLTARSGRHALQHRLEALGYSVGSDELARIHARFLTLADAKKQVFDDDLHALMADERGASGEKFTLDSFSVTCGTGLTPSARVRVSNGDGVIEKSASGDGPVDACFNAVDCVTGVPVKLLEYRLNAATAEKAALGEAQVTLEWNGRTVSSHGASTDVVEASVRAYMNALNRLLA